jgi:DNA-directed RNA polymerase subunit RPC12/RpoP
MRRFKSPVKCPYCHKLLFTIQLQTTKVLEWKRETDGEGLFEDNGQGSLSVVCYNCGKEIGHYTAIDEWGIFPDDTVIDVR